MPLPLEPSQILLAAVLARSALEIVSVATRQAPSLRSRARAAAKPLLCRRRRVAHVQLAASALVRPAPLLIDSFAPSPHSQHHEETKGPAPAGAGCAQDLALPGRLTAAGPPPSGLPVCTVSAAGPSGKLPASSCSLPPPLPVACAFHHTMPSGSNDVCNQRTNPMPCVNPL